MKEKVNIIIQKMKKKKKEVELVEAKGKGHPDSICDAVCEAASKALSKAYIEKFGEVLHHNIDKALLIGGEAKPAFKGGKIIKPFKLIIAGRATSKVGKKKINVVDIIEKAALQELARFRHLKKSHFKIIIDVKEGAANLKEVFKHRQAANDTSFGAAHWPHTPTEKITKDISNLINSENFFKKFPFCGEDNKVMTIRIRDNYKFVVAIAFIDKYFENMKQYIKAKEEVKQYLADYIKKRIAKFKLDLNALDDYKSIDSVYLTVTGLSAEQGDDGSVGRGNRADGLIYPGQAMSLEAVAGKNIRHPGKIYQLLALEIAKNVKKLPNVSFCEVQICSEIGKSLKKPEVVYLRTIGYHQKIKDVVEKTLNNLEKLQRRVIFEKDF